MYGNSKKTDTFISKLDPAKFDDLPDFARDVSQIGHFGTGNLEISLKNEGDLQEALNWCEKAYQKVGG